MKKNKLFIVALLTLPLLAACSQSIFYPEYSYPGNPLLSSRGNSSSSISGDNSGGENNSSNNSSQGSIDEDEDEEGDIDRSEFNMTVYFYYDYSHSDEPICTMRWYMLVPIEEKNIPEAARLEDKDAQDPLYWKFLGYSEYPSALDESLLWDFENDYKQSNTLKLYGIWVAR